MNKLIKTFQQNKMALKFFSVEKLKCNATKFFRALELSLNDLIKMSNFASISRYFSVRSVQNWAESEIKIAFRRKLNLYCKNKLEF